MALENEFKDEFGSSRVCPILGVVVVFWPSNEFHSSKF